MDIVIAGSLAYDRIMDFPGSFADHILPDKIHILNVCFLVEGLREMFGGTGGNIAYTLKLLGESPVIAATAGHDFGKYQERLEAMGLATHGITLVEDEFTAGAYITTDKADNQITGFNPGAMKKPSHYDLSGLDPKDAMVIVSPTNVDDMKSYPARCKELGIPYIFDPGQQIPALSGEEMKAAIDGAFALVTNDYELEMILKATSLSKDAVKGMCRHVVTTLGGEGSIVYTEGTETGVPPVMVDEVKDPTGAGDAFRAGMLFGLAQGKPMAEACGLGSAAASFCVEQYGTQVHSFDAAAFKARYDSVFG